MTTLIDLVDTSPDSRDEVGTLGIQNAALRALFGSDASVAQLNEVAIQYLDVGLKYQEDHPLGSSPLFSIYRTVARVSLEHRQIYFDSGTPLELILLESPDEIRRLFMDIVPFYTIGEYGFGHRIYGDDTFAEDTIMQLITMRWTRDVYEGLVFGGTRLCPYDVGPHRLCGVERQNLCDGVQYREGASPCKRQEAVDHFLANPKYGGRMRVQWLTS